MALLANAPVQHPAAPRLLARSGNDWTGIDAALWRMPAGRTQVAAMPTHRLGIHVGPPVNADCRCDGLNHRRVQSHGDIDIVPAGLDGSWEDDADCTILRIQLSPALIARVAGEMGDPPDGFRIEPRLQLRDPAIEHIAWALKAEIEATHPVGRLYADSLGMALATRLVQGGRTGIVTKGQTLAPWQKQRLVAFIEAHLDQDLALADLAGEVGLGLSHFKTVFRATMGMPAHRYVIHRRVAHARRLLLADHSIAEAALAAGFADQSHLAYWMRRINGVSPRTIRQSRR